MDFVLGHGTLEVMRFMPKLALLAAVGVSGCKFLEPPPAPSFEATVKVVGDPDEPVAGAKVTYKTQLIGITDAAGRLSLRLKGAEGEVFDLNVACPTGYQSPSKPLTVTLRRIADQTTKPEYRVSCPPTLRKIVVAVRAENGANLPVKYLGREVARTDASGAAHVKLDVTPNQAIQLVLDTADEKDLRPQSPAHTFDVKGADDVFVLDQNFKVERKIRYYSRPRASGPKPL